MPRGPRTGRTLPVALTIAGSDSGGGAGIQADLATMAARGVHGTSALTAITAQNTTGVEASEVLAPSLVTAQIETVFEDFEVGALKTGMLGDAAVTAAVAESVEPVDCPVVVDPVVVAESGAHLLSDAGIETVRDQLLPAATLVTPNVLEAELLADTSVRTPDDAERAGQRLCELGADAALVTGGHLDGDPVDVLVGGKEDGEEIETFRSDRISEANTHGSGCTLSSAIAAELAQDSSLSSAVESARAHIDRAIRHGRDVGRGTGPVEHLAPLKSAAGAGNARAAVREAVRIFERGNLRRLVPEVGTNVAVAPDCAVEPADVVAVAGRIHRVPDGVRATGEVRAGASSHIARFLLGVREIDDSVSAACNVRADEEIVAIVQEQLEVETIDRADEPAEATGTMDWAASEAMTGREVAPDAVLDGGAVGKEPMIRLLGADSSELLEKVRNLHAALD